MLVLLLAAQAATVVPAPAPQAVIIAPAQSNVLRAGAEIPVQFVDGLVSDKNTLRPGQRVNLRVAENIMLNGLVVIPAGTPVIGEVTNVKYKGMWGKSGAINGRIISARVGDRTIRLSGTFDDKGVSGTAGVVAAVVFVPVAGFFITGTSARIPPGSFAKAYLDEDLAVSAAAPAPQVITAQPLPVSN